MKKNFFMTLLAAMMGFMTANAQDDNTYNVVISLSNGSTITLGANDVKDITFNDGELVVTGEAITTLVDQVEELKKTIESQDKDIKGISDSFTDLKENLEKLDLENTIKSLQRMDDLLDEKASSAQDMAKDNSTKIEELQSAIEALQAAVEELKNNGGEKKNLPEFVDLGLSVKWASYNVGATKPEEVGNYYAWGEIEPKENYSQGTYKFYDEDLEEVKMPGVFNSSTFGYYIGGDPELDAVTANYGAGYRLPTQAEGEELKAKCTWEWVTENDVQCAKVTGPNGNFILLPVGGIMQGTAPRNGFQNRAYYWTADSDGEEEDQSFQLMFYNSTFNVSKYRVYNGVPVRGVQP